MRLLLDTHTLLWAVESPGKLSVPALTALQDPANDRLLSAATIWELAIKLGQKKIQFSLPFRTWMEAAIADLKLSILPISIEYAECQSNLPAHHKDPFDRLLIAQSLVEAIPVVTGDTAFDAYSIIRIW